MVVVVAGTMAATARGGTVVGAMGEATAVQPTRILGDIGGAGGRQRMLDSHRSTLTTTQRPIRLWEWWCSQCPCLWGLWSKGPPCSMVSRPPHTGITAPLRRRISLTYRFVQSSGNKSCPSLLRHHRQRLSRCLGPRRRRHLLCLPSLKCNRGPKRKPLGANPVGQGESSEDQRTAVRPSAQAANIPSALFARADGSLPHPTPPTAGRRSLRPPLLRLGVRANSA